MMGYNDGWNMGWGMGGFGGMGLIVVVVVLGFAAIIIRGRRSS